MTKIRAAVPMFIIAQVALAREHTSRRAADVFEADRAVRHNWNTLTNSLSNTLDYTQLVSYHFTELPCFDVKLNCA